VGSKEEFSKVMKALHKMLKEASKDQLKDNCPHCHGSGEYYESADAHRSAGIVPCRAWTKTHYCARGKWVKK
jgi:hypothetical protein